MIVQLHQLIVYSTSYHSNIVNINAQRIYINVKIGEPCFAVRPSVSCHGTLGGGSRGSHCKMSYLPQHNTTLHYPLSAALID